MDSKERDEIFFRNKKGRYAPGGKWEHATRPMEGGSAGARGAVQVPAIPSRPLGMNWGDSRAQLPQVEPIEPVEPVESVGYAPISMRRDPFITGYKNDTPDDTPAVMSAAAVADLPDFAPAGMIRIG